MKKKYSKKLFIIIGIIILSIFIIIFLKNNYKNLKTGNNMSNKTIKEIEEYILNISSYEAKVSVTVESNKNTNKYVLEQKFNLPNISNQIVLEPANIAGMELIYDGINLTIRNTKLNLNKVYENYSCITENYLCLETFINQYKNSEESKIYEKDNEIILETNYKTNKYIQNAKLYLNKETGNPTKMIINDVNQKDIVYILYNEIKINNLTKNDVLAFKLFDSNTKLY